MQTLLTIGIFVLVFALLIVLLILVIKRSIQNAQLEYEVRRDGVPIEGHVLARREHTYRVKGGMQTDFLLKYAYRVDGVVYQHEADLLESDYQAHPEGAVVNVIYHPRQPQRAYLLINGRLNGTIPY